MPAPIGFHAPASTRKSSRNATIVVEADLDLVQLVASMGRTDEVFAALLDPAHRAPGETREEGNQHVLGVDVPLGAEPAAHIERYAAHACFRQTQDRCRLAP